MSLLSSLIDFLPERMQRYLTSGKTPFYPVSMFAGHINNPMSPILIDTDRLLEIYYMIPHLRATIDRKAEMFKNMDIRLRKIKDGTEVTDHEVLRLLAKPNPLQSQEEWLAQLSIMADVFAMAFVYGIKPLQSSGIPKVLWTLPSWGMEVIPTGNVFEQSSIEEIVKEYKLTWGSRIYRYESKQIIQIQNSVNAEYLSGQSKIKSLQKALSNIEGAYKTRNILIYEKGAIGILGSESKDSDGAIPLGKEERSRLENEYRSRYGLGADQMKILITSSSVKWNPMSYPTKDLMLFEETEDDFQTILSAYGMARELFPNTKGATFENQAMAEQRTYQSTMQPLADSLMRTLNERFGLAEQGLELWADYGWMAIMQTDEEKKANSELAKAERLSIMLRDGVITKQQYAEEMNIEYTEGTGKESAVDRTSNAQAELRGTVGGLTGIIELNRAVAEGSINREAAVQILISRYGDEPAVAETMITTQMKPAEPKNDPPPFP